MVDWVSLTISIVALIVSSVLGIISLRISWKNLLTQFGPYIILKEKASDSKDVEIENKGNGMAYNVQICVWDNNGLLFRIVPFITYLGIDEIRVMDFKRAISDEYIKKKTKNLKVLDKIKFLEINCQDIHNATKTFYYEYYDYDERFVTQKFIPLEKKQFKRGLSRLQGK